MQEMKIQGKTKEGHPVLITRSVERIQPNLLLVQRWVMGILQRKIKFGHSTMSTKFN